jgi:small subunit ribosomal protein S1
MKLHRDSDPILQFLADYSNETLVHTFLNSFSDRRNAELRRLQVRVAGLEAENRVLRTPDASEEAATPEDDVAIEDGAVVTAQIIAINDFYASIKLDKGIEHLVALAEFIEGVQLQIEVGEFVNLVAKVTPDGLALSHLEYKKMLHWVELMCALDIGADVEVTFEKPAKSGYSASYHGIPVFIPHAQSDLAPGKHVEGLFGTTVSVRLLELDRAINHVKASRRVVMEEARDTLLASLRSGDLVDGVIKTIAEFGAFIDLGGLVGLLHSTQMGPLADSIVVGASIKTRVLKVDLEQKKVSLTGKPMAADSWEQLLSRFAVGSTLEGKIKKLNENGAFVEVVPGINGLVFQSDFKQAHVNAATAPKVGDMLSVMIRNINVERRRIRLRVRSPTQAKPTPTTSGGHEV